MCCVFLCCCFFFFGGGGGEREEVGRAAGACFNGVSFGVKSNDDAVTMNMLLSCFVVVVVVVHQSPL